MEHCNSKNRNLVADESIKFDIFFGLKNLNGKCNKLCFVTRRILFHETLAIDASDYFQRCNQSQGPSPCIFLMPAIQISKFCSRIIKKWVTFSIILNIEKAPKQAEALRLKCMFNDEY